MRDVYRPLSCLGIVAAPLCVGWLVSLAIKRAAADELPPAKAEPRADAAYCTSPDAFVGPQACAECHRAEYQIWARTSHANNAYDLLRTSSNARLYARKLGIEARQITQSPRCLTCHSTPLSQAEQQTGLVHGVTCEACHNAAGGAQGWLNPHSSYGSNLLRREDESAAHRAQRIEQCRLKGQFRSDDLYALAKRCYECHVIADEELVVQGGHHAGNPGFEMTAWFDKQVRHNVFLAPAKNRLAPSLAMDSLWRRNRAPSSERDHRRLMYVVSLRVDLEVSLRNRGNAEHSSFARAAATRITAAHSRLATISESDSAAVLAPLVAELDNLQPTLFLPPEKEDSRAFLRAAERTAATAKTVSSAGDGRRFTAADRYLDFATP